ITAIGGMQQNPCGAQEASLFFVNTTDWGTCATEGGTSVPPSGAGSAGSSDIASQQTITLVGGMQQNPCGQQAASLLFVTSQDFCTCCHAAGDATPAPSVDAYAGSSDIASQQSITLVGGMQQNPCGQQAASLLFVASQDFGTCGTPIDSTGP